MHVCMQVGKAVAVAALDMMPSSDGSSATANPWSRLPNCQQHKTIAEARAWLKSRLLTTDPYRAQVCGRVVDLGACCVCVCVCVFLSVCFCLCVCVCVRARARVSWIGYIS